MKVFLLTLTILLYGTSAQGHSSSFWDRFFDPRLSRAPKFEGNKFFNLTSIVHLDQMEGSLEAFGDFNSDRYTDIFVLAPNRSTISIHLWDTDVWKFVGSTSVDIIDDLVVDGIAATDLNHDGCLDMLVQGHYDTASEENVIQFYYGNYQRLSYRETLNFTSIGQVMIMDYNSDMYPDLMGSSSINGTIKRYVLLNNKTTPGEFVVHDVSTELASFDPPPIPHSDAFVDLDGDCLADLALSSVDVNGEVSYSFYINDNGNYTKNQTGIRTVNGAGLLTFADIDGDGSTDIMFPVCYPLEDCSIENSIHIIYNQQERICQSIFDRNCRPDGDLCSHRDFRFESFDSVEGPHVVIVPSTQFNGSRFLKSTPRNPLKIRHGDYNLDGYPDIILFTSNFKGEVKLEVWESVPCSTERCHAGAVGQERRTFVKLDASQAGYLSEIEGAYAAAFWDFDEDGTNDIIISARNPQNQNMTLHGAFNNINNDAYFFKTTGLNGVCTQWCEGDILPDPKPYGVNQYGATIKFSLSDMNGNRRANSVPQLSQTAYLPLQTPYTLNGLGRPANYIDYFYLGVPINTPGTPHWNAWPGLIPNSQIVAIPYPPDIPPNWTPELYISPSGSILWTIIAAITSLALFGIVVIVLTCLENKQDEQEIKDTQHLFSFSYFS